MNRHCKEFTVSVLYGVLIGLLIAAGCRKAPDTVDKILPSLTKPSLVMRNSQTPPAIQDRILTDTATLSPTVTKTRIPTPTITPATLLSTPDPNSTYRLKKWSPELANQLISDLQFYPETLPYQERGYLQIIYYYSFHYAILAQEEAIFRYPNAEQVSKWQQGHAYNLALSNNEQVGEAYARLLVDWLNSGRISLDGLKDAFEREEPRLILEATPLNPIKDHDHDLLVLIGANVWSGDMDTGVALWLFDQDGVFSAYPLQGESDFDFPHGLGISVYSSDLTGDGVPEAIVSQGSQRGAMMFHNSLSIFDLTQVPPKRIEMIPEVDSLYIENWSVGGELDTGDDLRIASTTISEHYCSGGATGFGWNYRWNGNALVLSSMDLLGMSGLEGEYWFCYGDYVRGLFREVVIGNEAARQLIPELVDLDIFQTHLDELIEYLNPENFDEVRFLQGMLLFLVGDVDAAKGKMKEIIDQPFVPNSLWVEPARQLNLSMSASKDILSACFATGVCNQILNTQEIINLIPPDRLPEAVQTLAASGLVIWEHGQYDFDQDGRDEVWFVYSDSIFNKDNKDFCLLYSDGNVIKSEFEFFSTGADILPLKINLDSSSATALAYRITAGSIPLILEIQTHEKTEGSVFELNQLSGWQIGKINGFKNDLFSNSEPSEVSQLLEDFYKNNLQNQAETTEYGLAYFYYLRGLASEMAGEAENAASLYMHLWKYYPDSPFAIFARSKLEIDK